MKITKPFDFKRVPERIAKKHRPLFTRLAFKPDLRRQHERRAGRFKPLRHGLPVGQRQHQSKVRHRNTLVADLTGQGGGKGLAQMQRKLMVEKIEINPGRAGTAFRTPQHTAVELPRHSKVANVKRKMEKTCHAFSLSGPRVPQAALAGSDKLGQALLIQ